MPGIVGFVTRRPDQQACARELSRMLQWMRHQPAYSYGTLAVPELGCYLGWVNHKGSYADRNPLVSTDGDVILVFSGEHFAHDDESHLSGGDSARRLLRSYLHDGERFVDKINGWFAGVLVDRRRGSILLINDRFGVHRVYCHESDDTFTFASEAKAILSIRPRARALSTEGLGHFLGFGAVFENRTLFEGVSLLPGGSSWEVSDPTGIRKRRYFDVRSWEERPQLDPAAFYTKFKDTVTKILPAYFRSSSTVGLSLTGGLDTRIVMAGKPSEIGLPSYTYAGVYRECYDIDVARSVAAACGCTHQTLGLGRDFFDHFDTFAEQTVWLTDGCLDLCGTHEVYYSRLARQLAPIRLTGNYGSEVLRSVSTFKYNPPSADLFEPAAVGSMVSGAKVFDTMRARHPVTFAAFNEIPWNHFGRLSSAQSELTLRSPYMDNELLPLLYQAPPGSRETTATSLRLIADMNPSLAAIATDMGYGGEASLTARVRPLYRYLLFKAEWYYNTGMPHWAAKLEKALPLRALEPLFLGTHKIDHYRLWFQKDLKAYLQAVLNDRLSRSRPYLDRRGYDELIAAHHSGRRNCLNDINRVVALELIQRLLIERDYTERASEAVEAVAVNPLVPSAG